MSGWELPPKTVVHVPPKPYVAPVWTERMLQQAVRYHFDYQRTGLLAYNIMFGGGEMDVLFVTASGYIVEVECKKTVADWNNDQSKAKWQSEARAKVCRFYYAVPWSIKDKAPPWLPAGTGLLGVAHKANGVPYVREVIREATRASKYKITERERIQILRSVYFRYWDQNK